MRHLEKGVAGAHNAAVCDALQRARAMGHQLDTLLQVCMHQGCCWRVELDTLVHVDVLEADLLMRGKCFARYHCVQAEPSKLVEY